MGGWFGFSFFGRLLPGGGVFGFEFEFLVNDDLAGQGLNRGGEGVGDGQFGRLVGEGEDIDGAEGFFLFDADEFLADEFEECEEEADDFAAAGAALEDGFEGEGFFPLGAVEDVGFVDVDGGVVMDDLVAAFAGEGGLHEAAEGFEKIPDLEGFEVEFLFELVGLAEFLEVGEGAGVALGLVVGPIVEFAGEVLEFFVFEELADQFEARVAEVVLFLARFGLAAGQEHGGLDFHEGGGHDEEFAGEVDVELLEHIDILEVLVGDGGDGDVLDVHLGAADEVEEQVEGAVVDVDANAIVCHKSKYIKKLKIR